MHPSFFRKKQSVVITLLSLFTILFLRMPSVAAAFTDTSSVNLGLKIEMGTVRLEGNSKNNENQKISFSGEDITQALKTGNITLQNKGTFNSKLAYRLLLLDEQGNSLSTEKVNKISISLEGTEVEEVSALTPQSPDKGNGYYFFQKTGGDDPFILEPEQSTIIDISASIENSFREDFSFTLQLDFLLLPESVEEPYKQSFYDTCQYSQIISIMVPKKETPESDWPEDGKFTDLKDGIKYYLDSPAIFGETNDINDPETRLQNLDDIFLYIKFPESEPVLTERKGEKIRRTHNLSFTLSPQENNLDLYHINQDKIEVNEQKNGYKVPISIDFKYKDSETSLYNKYPNGNLGATININVEKLKGGEEGYEYKSNINFGISRFASKIVLNTDRDYNQYISNFKDLEYLFIDTKSSVDKKLIDFYISGPKVGQGNNIGDLVPLGKEVTKVSAEILFDDEESLPLDKRDAVSVSVEDKKIYLQMKQPLAQEYFNAGPQLVIKLTGNSGNTIRIVRKLTDKRFNQRAQILERSSLPKTGQNKERMEESKQDEKLVLKEEASEPQTEEAADEQKNDLRQEEHEQQEMVEDEPHITEIKKDEMKKEETSESVVSEEISQEDSTSDTGKEAEKQDTKEEQDEPPLIDADKQREKSGKE